MKIVDLGGKKFPDTTLRALLPDVESALFFAKLYQLDAADLSTLFYTVFRDPVVLALTAEGETHSIELQDYVVSTIDELSVGDIVFDPAAPEPKGVILPEVWESLEVEIADAIQQVADKLKDAVAHMPGKQGQMLFKSMAVLNSKRPVIGDYKAQIHHPPHNPALVILDVSGSMTEEAVTTILEDVLAMSYTADAWFAIVSNTATLWHPGAAKLDDVRLMCEYGGTHYEQLLPIFDMQDWGTVVTVADYDSSWSAKDAFDDCINTVDQVLDISLVSRPTFLSECVGRLSKEPVKPLMVARSDYSILHY